MAGDNVKALEWINKGIERNADSHYGTEWLHVRILKAKIELESDKTWLENNSVLGLDFGSDPAPIRPRLGPTDHNGNRLSLEDTARAIEYQLHERLQFVPPPNAVVADLLSDLGNLVALTEAVEAAIPIYELSAEYAAGPLELLQQRTAQMRSIAAKNFLSGTTATGIGILLTAVALVILAVSCFGLALYYRHRRAKAQG